MEQASGPPPPPRRAAPPPVPPLEDAEPATREEVRALRRWLIVAIVWAVAASAIGLIALVTDQDSTDEATREDAAAEVARLGRTLDRRIDSLEARVQDLPQREDLSTLEDRVRRAEGRASAVAGDARGAADELSKLEDRVKALEESSSRGTATTTGPSPSGGSSP